MLGELNKGQIEQVLLSELIGRIGCYADGQTYVVPITYVYDGESIYGHSVDGMKLRMMRKNPNVCFEVDDMENMASWRSVIAWGTFEELTGDEATHAMQLLVNRLMPLMTSETAASSQRTESTGSHRASTAGRTASVYRIRLTERTGRFEKRV
jgi:nitroimidazol reductase NimA-like FMN-containing flavoprotein (pyridoxamine 5'-phosphate oxidase superfamily)